MYFNVERHHMGLVKGLVIFGAPSYRNLRQCDADDNDDNEDRYDDNNNEINKTRTATSATTTTIATMITTTQQSTICYEHIDDDNDYDNKSSNNYDDNTSK